MGKRGPAPTPTALRLLRGNPGKRPINKREPKIPPATPAELEAPAELTPEQRAHWDRIVAELEGSRVLTTADHWILLNTVRALAACDALDRIVNGPQGWLMTIRDEHGAVKWIGPSSSSTGLRQWQKEARANLAELGLTPAARSRVTAAPDDKGAGPSWLEVLRRG